jgi:predicted ATPase
MFALNYTAKTETHCGNYAAANSLLEQLIALADQKAAPYWESFGISVQGCVLVGTGDAFAAVQRLTLGITALRSTGATLYVPWFPSNLARAYGGLGELDDAWRCIDEAMTLMQTTKERWCEAEVNRIAGEVTLKSLTPNAARAEAYFERALAVARQQQAKSWELRAAMSLARLWRSQGNVQQARELLAPVYGWFTEGFDTRDLKEAKALLEELAS